MASREISISEIDPFIIQRVVIEATVCQTLLRAEHTHKDSPSWSVTKMDIDNPCTLRGKPRRAHVKSAKGTCVCAQSLSHVQLFCDPMDYSLPGSTVHRTSQARILEWVAISFSRGSSRLKDQTHVSCLVGGFFTTKPPGKLRGTVGDIYFNMGDCKRP